MEFIQQIIRRDIINELTTNYDSDLDNSRWLSIIETELTEYLKTYTISLEAPLRQRSFVDRRLFTMDESTCQARVWNEGYGGQCSRKKKFGDFCGKHNTPDKCWCGIISEKRPDHPINTKGKIHTWKS